MTQVFEFTIWADGEARDTDGNLLDREGNIIQASSAATEKESS